MNRSFSRQISRRARRRGVSLYIFAGSLPVVFGVLGLSIDMGTLYTKRSAAQRAADAAALAGAIQLVDSTGAIHKDTARTAAITYATNNAYTADPVTTVEVTINPDQDSVINDVQVNIVRDEPVYFAPVAEGMLNVLGFTDVAAQFSRKVGVTATAEKSVVAPSDMSMGGPYGIADPAIAPANNSVFGTYAEHQHGDRWSTKYLQDGTLNPLYSEGDTGNSNFFFTMTVTQEYLDQYPGNLHVQIFDPDTNASGSNDYDEVRSPNKNIPGYESLATTTVTEYEILDAEGKRVAYYKVGSDPSVNNKWVTPDGFAFRPSKAGEYRIRVRSLDGSSENGYKLRAGPEEGIAVDDVTWNDRYGDKGDSDPSNIAVPIVAKEKLQLNFTKTGVVNFRLGYLDSKVAGKEIYVEKFDVDINSQYINYGSQGKPRTDGTNNGNVGGDPATMPYNFAGTFPEQRNNTANRDYYTVPADYQGGDWYTQYSAGQGDTSSWQIFRTNTPGSERVYLTN